MSIDDEIGPRVVGGRYWNGYWAKEYEVVAVHRGDDVPMMGGWRSPWAVTVRDADGQRTHSTAWDPARDRVL